MNGNYHKQTPKLQQIFTCTPIFSIYDIVFQLMQFIFFRKSCSIVGNRISLEEFTNFRKRGVRNTSRESSVNSGSVCGSGMKSRVTLMT